MLDTLESRRDLDFGSAESFQGILSVPPNGFYVHIADSSAWQECLILLIKFWARLADEMPEVNSSDTGIMRRVAKATCHKKSGKRRLLESTFNGNKEVHVLTFD